MLDEKVAIFEKRDFAAGICIVERDTISYSNSVKPTFFVEIMHEVINRVILNGGKVILDPTLLKQQNYKGEILIGANLIYFE